jgi:hypothetical protein
VEKVSEIMTRAKFDIIIHIFKKASAKKLILLQSPRAMEKLIVFCLTSESILVNL